MRAVVGTEGNGRFAGLVFGVHSTRRMGDFVKFKCLPSFLSAVQAVAPDHDNVRHKISTSQIGIYNIVGKPYQHRHNGNKPLLN